VSGYLPYALAVWLFLVGLYGVVTSRNLIHLTVCLSVAQSGTYVLLLAIGYEDEGTAPILAGVPESAKKVDPVVQALTLTDIVVAVAIAALLLAIAVHAHERTGSLDPNDLRELRE
jgi:multicomponent Na+:H+ antiporter subunit C